MMKTTKMMSVKAVIVIMTIMMMIMQAYGQASYQHILYNLQG